MKILNNWDFRNNFRLWRFLSNFWGVVIFAAIIYDFIKDNAISELFLPLAIVYLGVLTIYVGQKEFERWYSMYDGRHPGEMFVIVWTAIIFGIFLLDIILKKPYQMPSEIASVYLTVLGILAVTKKSKALFEKKKKHS